MKRLYWIFFVAMAWCSCYDDKGNYDYRDLEELSVAIKEEGPHNVLFGGTLALTSEVKTVIPETDLQYDWEIQWPSPWYNPFVSVAQGRELNYKWENEELNVERAYTMRLHVTQLSNDRHFYSEGVTVNLRTSPSPTGLMVLHGDDRSCDIGIIEAPEFQLAAPASGFVTKTTPASYSAGNGGEKITGKGTGLWQTYLSNSTSIPENIVVIALTDNGSALANSKTLANEGDWNDMFIGGLNSEAEGIYIDGSNMYVFDGGSIFKRNYYRFKVDVPTYDYDEGNEETGYRFYPYVFNITSSHSAIGQVQMFDKKTCGFVAVGQANNLSNLSSLKTGKSTPFDPGDMKADLVHWANGGQYGMLAVMKSKADGSYFIAEMDVEADDAETFAKYKYDLAVAAPVDWAFGTGRINMCYYADAQGVYRFTVDGGNAVSPEKLTKEDNTEVTFDGDITLMKILKPTALGGSWSGGSYYMNNKVMVVGTYGGSAGSGQLYSLELDENSGKVKSVLGVYEGFDRIEEVEIKGY